MLNPSATNYLYFVANGEGASVFSATLEEHNVAVANWRKIEREIRARQAEAAKAQANNDNAAAAASEANAAEDNANDGPPSPCASPSSK